MFQQHLVRDADVEPLADAVCRTLDRVGILCENEVLLRALADAGARVDMGVQRAWFPPEMTRDFIASVRKQSSGEIPEPIPFTPAAMPSVNTQIAQIFYDYTTGERRNGNRQDQVTLTKLGSVLSPTGAAGHSLVQTDVNPRLESLESALVLAEYAYRPSPPFAWYVDQVDYLIEMGEIMGMPNWFSYGATCFAHPLRFDKAVVDKFVRRAREGGVAGLTAMPVAGMTTPVTVEGFVAVAAAEHVATWLAGRALNENVPLGGSMWAATLDMKTGAVSYSSFDAMYYGCACAEFLRRWTGVCIAVGGGEYCDAREPGLYTALEKAHKAMTIAAFTGRHPSIGQGMLECGRSMCPVQLMVERDLAVGTTHFAQGMDPSPERIGMGAIESIQLGLTANHMMTDHTMAHFRELWLPNTISRGGWNGAAYDRALLDRAQGQVEDLLNDYCKPEGRESDLEKMRLVVERARRHLC